MNLKRSLKRWLYGSCPGLKGVFPYFGERIHFPPGSLIFELAMLEGIFEHENLRLLQSALRPDTWAFDIGANIGLMSAPLLDTEPTLHVVSVEASPRTAEHLARTIAGSARRDRWQLVAKALGVSEGEIEFFAATGTDGVFDGLRDTGRTRGSAKVKVPLTTLDTLWRANGRPSPPDRSCFWSGTAKTSPPTAASPRPFSPSRTSSISRCSTSLVSPRFPRPPASVSRPA
jgi:FkbM family methyltransferase